MFNSLLKKLFLLIIILSISSYPQGKRETYIVELDTIISFKSFVLPNNYLNHSGLLNYINNPSKKDNKRFLDIAKFFKKIKPLSARKFIRRLPEDVTFLKTVSGRKFNVEGFQRLLVVELPGKIDLNTLTNELKTNKTIKKISLDIKTDISAWPPNDSDYTFQPQFYNTSYNIDLPRAWNYTAGNSGIKIAVVDNGIDYAHPDLGAGFGIGYRVRGGWDYKDNDSDPRPIYSTETHGTPIAGILGAINWNNTGVVGIAGGSSSLISSGCQLFSLRVTDEEVGANGINKLQSVLIAEAVLEAATDPSVNNGFGYGVNVINCSFSSTTGKYWDWESLFYQSYYNSFAWAYLNNVVVSSGRGNVGGDIAAETVIYPASFSNGGVVMSVSGVDNFGYLATQSCYGNGVTIAAPFYLDYTTQNNNSYGGFGGTSNSTPFVAGVGALVFSRFLERGTSVYAEDVQNILKISAEQTTEPEKYGVGRLDAGQALYISSEPFVLEHHTADINRTVTTVANPADDILNIYYPYGTYTVYETKKITATFRIPNEFNLDSTWVWANSYTLGLEWGNPSYGMPNATLVSRVGTDVTFETYCYKMMPVGGSNLEWYPADPNDPQAQIKVTLLGKKELTASISGPTFLNPYQNGTWTANADGGYTPYTYDWYYRYPGALPKNSSIKKPPAGYWNLLGIHTYQMSRTDNQDFELKCVVKDNVNNTATSNIIYVSVTGGFAPGTASHTTENELIQNYPNPFNPSTEIKYSLKSDNFVTIKIYDVLGRVVATLVNENKPAGFYTVNFDASKFSSGVYFYTIKTDEFFDRKKMILLR